MANTVIALKKSATPSSKPGSLANGELALNFADGILYYKAANGTIAAISGTGTGAGPSYGVINANSTILLAAISGDTFSILPGNNITVTGDAINDRVTIGADFTAANSWANTKLTNGSVTLAGSLNTTGQITSNGYIYITPSDGIQEGGEIQLLPAGNYINWVLDSYQNNHRTFTRSNSTLGNVTYFHANGGVIRMGVNRQDPSYTLDVGGTVNASALYVNGVQINTGTVDLTPANNWANTKLSNTSGVSFAGDLYFPTGSKVGIGISSASYTLDVAGTIRGQASALSGDVLIIGNDSKLVDIDTAHTAGLYSVTNSTVGSLKLGSSGETITGSNGNIGIGTTGPVYKLDVAGSANISNATLLVAGQNVLASFASGNNYAGAMANASNAYATATFGTITNTAAAFGLSNTVYTAVNSAFAVINAAYTSSNADYVLTNAVFTQSNTDNVRLSAAYVVVNSAFGSVNTVGGYANTAGLNANQAGVIANAAFGAANQAGVVANNANTYAGSTYVKKAGDTITGDLVIQGNVTISGNTTYANSQTLLIGDNIITLNNDIPVATAPSEDAGIEIKRGSSANVSLLWREGNDNWTITNDGTIWYSIATNNDILSANNYAGAMANASNAYASSVGTSANVYSTTSTTAANNYAGAMANSVNAAFATADSGVRTYVNTSVSAANNYAGVMSNSSNGFASTIVDANLVTARAYTNTSTTSANNYAGAMANSVNAYSTATYGTITNTTAAFAAANQAGVIANAAFGRANTGTDLTPANNWANTVGTAGNAYASSVGTSANNYSGVMANAVNTFAMTIVNANLTTSLQYTNTSTAGSNNFAGALANVKLANVAAGQPITISYSTSVGNTTATINIATSGVTPATYGNSSIIPVITIDSYGRITSATNVALSGVTGGAGNPNSVINNVTTLITTGYTVASFNAGSNVASYGTWTPDPANGNYQYLTSNGSVTIAAPASNCAIDVLWTNDIAANSITFSGYTAPAGGGGDTYITANGWSYLLMIRKINNVATYVWKALQ